MVDEDLRTKLLALLPTGVPVEKGKVSASQPPVRVYYQRSESNREVDQSGHGMLYETWFDIEVGSLQDDAACQTLAQALKEGTDPTAAGSGLNGFRGTIGSTFIHGAFVADHGDDYQPRILDADEGYDVASFRVQIFHETA